MTVSRAREYAGMSDAERAVISGEIDNVMRGLTPEERVRLNFMWEFWRRPGQIRPAGEHKFWYMRCGRGYGKTRTGAEETRKAIEWCGRIALVGPTTSDIRKVMIEGEALALDTLVATPTGFTPIGLLVSGDLVLGGDGHPCRVTTAFPVLYDRPCFIVSVSGATIIADTDHKWLTSTHQTRRNRGRGPKHRPSVVTTAEMKATIKHRSQSNHAIRVTLIPGAVTVLPVPPYTLGMWLGDGTSKSVEITQHPHDQLHVRARLEADGYRCTDRSNPYSVGVLGLQRDLRIAGLLRNKHIPTIYLRASQSDRLDLLQGLIDSDGHVTRRGQVEFSNKNERLLADVAELASSLGIRVGINKHRVQFSTGVIVASLPRKASRIRKPRYEDEWRYIRSIEPVTSVPVRCIAVDSPDHTYLVTRHLVRTHNSGLLSVFPPHQQPLYEPSKVQVTFHNGAIASLYTAEEPKRLRGPQHGWAWVDEPASYDRGKDVIDNLRLGMRLGRKPWALLTGTPKPAQWLRDFAKEPGVIVTRGALYENINNLAETFIDDILGRFEGTRLGLQEVHGEDLDDTEGSLWKEPILDRNRLATFDPANPLTAINGWLIDQGRKPISRTNVWRIIVAVDPPGETAECGIIVAAAPTQGRSGRDHAVILEDASIAGPPEKWGKQVASAARRWNAERVFVESNQGGDMTRATIHAVDPDIRVQKITASVSKGARAEPVSALYERGLIHHAGFFPSLESQMTTWVPGEGDSPDRLDALVHAVASLLISFPTFASTVRSAASHRLG